MINFTVGPVMSCEEVLKIGSQSAPYFRTPEFSSIMLENEKLILKFLHAPLKKSRAIFLTTSGTGAMEACVMNVLNSSDKVIVINGGTFGKRFVELCKLHKRPYTEVKCPFGEQLKKEQLEGLESHTALLVNMDETSSGVLYDMRMISDFCKENNLLLIIDAISSFITDDLDMEALGADVVITGSQKALAVQPGISIIAADVRALKRIDENEDTCMYLSLKDALKNMERGQTPFTPAVTTLIQINKRLKMIEESGGIHLERERVRKITKKFREGMTGMPFEFVVKKEADRSNAVTAVYPTTCGARKIVDVLKEEYHIWVCPNGGDLADKVFRVGHIGCITEKAIDILFEALNDMRIRGII